MLRLADPQSLQPLAEVIAAFRWVERAPTTAAIVPARLTTAAKTPAAQSWQCGSGHRGGPPCRRHPDGASRL